MELTLASKEVRSNSILNHRLPKFLKQRSKRMPIIQSQKNRLSITHSSCNPMCNSRGRQVAFNQECLFVLTYQSTYSFFSNRLIRLPTKSLVFSFVFQSPKSIKLTSLSKSAFDYLFFSFKAETEPRQKKTTREFSSSLAESKICSMEASILVTTRCSWAEVASGGGVRCHHHPNLKLYIYFFDQI